MNIDNCIATSSGRWMDFVNPDPRQVSLEDIEAGLKRECRFSGQIINREHYSVAEHCVRLVEQAIEDGNDDPELLKALLMHDASEAYMRDIATPLKALLPQYKEIETKVQDAIHDALGVTVSKDHHIVIKAMDWRAVCTEARTLLPVGSRGWADVPSYEWNMYDYRDCTADTIDWGHVFLQHWEKLTR